MAEGRAPTDWNKASEDDLARCYLRLVRSCARPFFLTGGDYDDLVQEGMIGLLKAIRQYDATRSNNFEAFAYLCIRRQIVDALRRDSRNDVLASALLQPLESEDGQEHLPGAKVQQDPETELLAKESALEIQNALSGLLSAFEVSVLRLYLQGYTSSEIAHTLHRAQKSVDNATGRIRRKLAKYLNAGRQQD